jgi:hypothetical protein
VERKIRNEDGVIERLKDQDIDVMYKVLENASQQEVPIEVDGMVYFIPKPISDLIDSLAIQAGVDSQVEVENEA